MTGPITATCHCGGVPITLAATPAELTRCNCSLRRSYCVIWAYYNAADVMVPDGVETDTYAWNGRNVDFHRRRRCGCITHWMPRKQFWKVRGINANLMPNERISSIPVRNRDGADTGLNRAGFSGGFNFQIGWSHDEQNDEQVFA